jgi:glycerol-3-phosphate dehydrogenase subunit C
VSDADRRDEPRIPDPGRNGPGDVADGSDLRPGADDCYKCTACDTSCPVAAVDDQFPGPKFQGPEQWRLKRREDERPIDGSIMDCSNCMRCDAACPAGVPLSRMHNVARAEYVDQELSRFSRRYWRNRLLANYRTAASLGGRFPRLANALLGNSVLRSLTEKLLGITAEREFPAFAGKTFREWWRDRGRSQVDGGESGKRVAYFHGCYANYNTPEVGRALVRVFEHFGYEVVVPEKQGCSGTPMFANGLLDDARRHAEANVEILAALVEEGYDAVCSCTSCSLAIRQEYPELFEHDGVDRVAGSTHEAIEYLRIHEDLAGALEDATIDYPDLAYHAPCHARNQGLQRQAVELFDGLGGVEVTGVGEACSGISGTYGWKAEKYETSMAIGAAMFEHMAAVPGETGLTECPTCAMQMEHGTGYEVRHPLQVLEAALIAD